MGNPSEILLPRLGRTQSKLLVELEEATGLPREVLLRYAFAGLFSYFERISQGDDVLSLIGGRCLGALVGIPAKDIAEFASPEALKEALGTHTGSAYEGALLLIGKKGKNKLKVIPWDRPKGKMVKPFSPQHPRRHVA